MRDYIQKHITPALDAARDNIKSLVVDTAASETFGGSIVPGATNKREALKNCVVFGKVHVYGSGTMVDCAVMSGCTVYVGDGATVTNCQFDTMHPVEHNVIRIGKNVHMNKVMTCFDVDIGDGSTIVESCFGDPGQSESVTPHIKLGDNSLVTRTVISIRQPDQEDKRRRECFFGDRAVIIGGKLSASSQGIHIGDDFLYSDYEQALALCLGGTVSVASNQLPSPTENASQFHRDLQRDQICSVFYAPFTAGDRFYLGVSTRFFPGDPERGTGGVVLGDDVYIVPGESTVAVREHRNTPFAAISADSMKMGNGSTLVLDVPAPYETQQLRELDIKEGATLFFRNNDANPQDRFAGTAICVNKNQVIEL